MVQEAKEQITQSLSVRVRSGVLWNLAGNISQQVLRIGFSVVLARLLSPREFGLIGMAAVFTGFASMYVSLGLGQAIVQRKDLSPQHLSSAFTVSLSSAALLCLLLNLLAASIANIYREPALKPIIHVLSLQFVLSAFTLVHSALLQRGMRFKELSLIDLASFISGSLTAVTVAWLGGGVWSLVGNAMVMSTTSLVLLWWRSRWKPNFGFHPSAVRELWAYSKHLVGFNTMYYWARNADSYLIGKYCGAADVGVYSRAYQLMMLPVTQIARVVSGVMFPAMCELVSDANRFREATFKTLRIIALGCFPALITIAIVAEPLVLTLFGEKWRGVIPLVKILAWAGIVQSLCVQHLVYNPLGRTDVTLKVGLLEHGLTVLALVIGLRWGALGVAISYTAVWWLVVFPLGWSIASRMIGSNLWQVIWNLREITICTTIMGAIAKIAYLLCRDRTSPIIQVVGLTILAGVTYILVLNVLGAQAYREVLAMFRHQPKMHSSETIPPTKELI